MNNRYARTDPGDGADDDTSDPSWQPPAGRAAEAAPASPSRPPSKRAAAAAAALLMTAYAPMSTAQEAQIDAAVDLMIVQKHAAKRKRADDTAAALKRARIELEQTKAELAAINEAIAAKAEAEGLPQCPICLKRGNHTLMTVKQVVLPRTGLVTMVPTSPVRYCDTCPAGLNNSCPIRRQPISWARIEFRSQDLVGSSPADAMLIE